MAEGAQAQLSEEDVHKALLAFSAHDPERQGIRVCELGACFRAMGEDLADAEIFDVSKGGDRVPSCLPALLSFLTPSSFFPPL